MDDRPAAPSGGNGEAPSLARETVPLSPRRGEHWDDLSDFTTADRRIAILAGLAVIIGGVAALVAAALLGLIGLFTNLFYYGRFSFSFASPASNQLGVFAILVPIAGGLIIGGMARFGSERIRGHGMPEAIESILVHKSRIQPRLAVLKPLSAAISIGTGGPFGAEGPIIMTGGSVGSTFGQSFHLSAAERKVLLVAGAAGGMAATFNTPLSAVLLAVELLLFEWKPRSLIPVGVASITATLVRWPILGNQPVFPLTASPLPNLPIAVGAVLVGLSAAVLATILTRAVYFFEDVFRHLPVHWAWWPAIGGLIIGVGGLIDPRALGVGYDTIDLLLLGGLGVSATLLLLAVKGVIWSASLGSGTSGGVLAPLLMMGAAVGALWGSVLPFGSVTLWALVAMAAVLGGTMRVPFTAVAFALELTHDLNVVFPLLIAALTAEAITIFTLRRSILTEKVARRGVHVAREYSLDPLEVTPVRSVMHPRVWSVPEGSTVGDAARREASAPERHVGYTLLAQDGRPVGFVTKQEIVDYLAGGGDTKRSLRELAQPMDTVVFPDEPARVGASRLAQVDRSAVPVVDPEDPQRVLGHFSRESIFEARVMALQDEMERDRTLQISFPRLRIGERLLGVLPVSNGPEPSTAPTDPARSHPRFQSDVGREGLAGEGSTHPSPGGPTPDVEVVPRDLR